MREQQALPHVDSLVNALLEASPHCQGVKGMPRMHEGVVREPERTGKRFRLRTEADMARDETHGTAALTRAPFL